MTKPKTIGSQHFISTKEAKSFYKEILSRYAIGQTITGNDCQLLLELIHQHPRVAIKIGVGISIVRLFKDKAKGGTSCLYAELSNTKNERFSIKTAVDGK